MFLFLALSASLPVATRPEPQGDEAEWMRSSDVPSSEWSRAAITSFDLTLDATGRLIRCEITQTSGSKVLDEAVCSSLMRRAHYKPALDANGLALPSLVRDHVRWVPDGGGRNSADAKAADIIVQLDKSVLKKKTALVQVIEIVDSAGQIESCSAESPRADAELAQAACDLVRRPGISGTVRDAMGAAVRGARAFNVAFVAGETPGIVIR
jgi:hypothetical protein